MELNPFFVYSYQTRLRGTRVITEMDVSWVQGFSSMVLRLVVCLYLSCAVAYAILGGSYLITFTMFCIQAFPFLTRMKWLEITIAVE